VSVGLKHGIALAVTFGVIHVLVSPLPTVNAAYSGKSIQGFPLVTCAVMGQISLLGAPGAHPLRAAAFVEDDVLDRICVRLC
jgi:hypothetical protein